MNKKLALILSLLISLIGALLLGVYDYKTYYDPEGKNASTYTSKYKEYIIDKTFVANDDLLVQTEERLVLNEMFKNDYYSEEPIFKQNVTSKDGETRLYTIAVYKSVVKYSPDTSTSEYRYRYNTYIYNINYEGIIDLFKKQELPQDKTILETADDPLVLINFYPNDEYNDEESLYYLETSELDNYTLNNGEVINRTELDSYASFNLYDWSSSPATDDDGNPYYVKYLSYSAYPSTSDNFGLFDESAYVKVDFIMQTKDGSNKINYLLEEEQYEFKTQINGFNLHEEAKEENYKLGFNTSSSVREVLNNVDIDGVLKYDSWIITRYIWWQCLICFVILMIIVGGFFFALTYDQKNNSKKSLKKINKTKKK